LKGKGLKPDVSTLSTMGFGRSTPKKGNLRERFERATKRKPYHRDAENHRNLSRWIMKRINFKTNRHKTSQHKLAGPGKEEALFKRNGQ